MVAKKLNNNGFLALKPASRSCNIWAHQIDTQSGPCAYRVSVSDLCTVLHGPVMPLADPSMGELHASHDQTVGPKNRTLGSGRSMRNWHRDT